MATVPMHAPPRYSWFDRLCHRRPGLAIACARLEQQLARLHYGPAAGRRVLLAALVGSALVGAVVPGLAFYPLLAASWVEPEYKALFAHHAGIAIVDRGRHAVGVVPASLLPSPGTAVAAAAVPRHQTLPVVEMPEVWWRIVVVLEDRHLGSWRSLHGIDVGGLVRAVGSRGQEGGSSLAMQLVRALRHEVSDPREALLGKGVAVMTPTSVLTPGPIGADDIIALAGVHSPPSLNLPATGPTRKSRWSQVQRSGMR